MLLVWLVVVAVDAEGIEALGVGGSTIQKAAPAFERLVSLLSKDDDETRRVCSDASGHWIVNAYKRRPAAMDRWMVEACIAPGIRSVGTSFLFKGFGVSDDIKAPRRDRSSS